MNCGFSELAEKCGVNKETIRYYDVATPIC